MGFRVREARLRGGVWAEGGFGSGARNPSPNTILVEDVELALHEASATIHASGVLVTQG